VCFYARKKIIDVSKILKSWQHRKLTLLGKVTVIKTFAKTYSFIYLTAKFKTITV
jgi:hypothetical protein